MSLIALLLTLPLAGAAIILLVRAVRVRDLLAFLTVVILVALSIAQYTGGMTVRFALPHSLHTIFMAADILLLLFFLWRGMHEESRPVALLALLQLLLYLYVSGTDPQAHPFDIEVGYISRIMLLVINIVGGIIILYALEYIESEEMERMKKNGFIALLFFFLSVMNLIVTTDNLEIFFLAFELTTLLSYLLIRYRGDELARANAIRALWMNQIGGVAILAAMIISVKSYHTLSFDALLTFGSSWGVAAIAVLIIAAFVKGASLPFEKWLLGAMVAPTPVSAILHSATMVKIAPYIILKLAPAFTPFLSHTVTLFGSFVFMTASVMALGRDYFKEILGLSTVALLGLMMAMAAIDATESVQIVLVLIVFHAISKALLFLQAGILEKSFHFKYLSDFEYLYERSPMSVWMIVIGFASLTLPPFGAFWGKFFSLELLISMISQSPLYILVLVFITLGSVFLTLLYFKVLTRVLSHSTGKTEKVAIPALFRYSSYALFGLLTVGILLMSGWNGVGVFELLLPALLIFVIPLLLRWQLRSSERVGEYRCGEKDEAEIGAYYFALPEAQVRRAHYAAAALIALVLLGGML